MSMFEQAPRCTIRGRRTEPECRFEACVLLSHPSPSGPFAKADVK
jgi:hypothetical protein